MKNKLKIGGNNLLLLITIVLFIVMYGIGCVIYEDKGFGHFQTLLNLLITNAGLICVACGMTCNAYRRYRHFGRFTCWT